MIHRIDLPGRAAPDRERWSATWNTVRPEHARTVDELLLELRLDEGVGAWLVTDPTGGTVGAARMFRSRWVPAGEPPELVMAVMPGRESRAAEILEAARAAAREAGDDRVNVECSDRDGDRVLRSLLGEAAATCHERDVVSVLTAGAAREWRDALPADVRITWLDAEPALIASAHECFLLADADEPTSTPGCDRPLGDWLRDFATPWSPLADCCVAVIGDRVVGWANLERFAAQPGMAWNGFTGTHPDHRGRGIASLVKQHVLDRVRSLGVTALWTQNAVGNVPMLRINTRMGYEPRFTAEWWHLPV